MDLRRDHSTRAWADNLTFDVELLAGTGVSPMRVAAGEQYLPITGAASFIHEACHQWSFTRMAGLSLMCLQAWTLCSSHEQWYEWALNDQGTPSAEEAEVASSIARLEFVERVHRFFRPLFEGLALFAELDARPKTNPLPPPMEWGARLFEIERGWLPLTPQRRRLRFAAALEERRLTSALGEGTLDRRLAVLASPLTFEGDAYLPGYMFVRGLRRRMGDIDDGMFLNLAVLFLLDDPRLAALILDDSLSYRSRLVLIKEQLQRRVQLLLDQAPVAEKRIRDIGLRLWELSIEDRAKIACSAAADTDAWWRRFDALGPTRIEVSRILDQKQRLRVGTIETDLIIRRYGERFILAAEPREGTDGRHLGVMVEGDYEEGDHPAVVELFVELMGTEIIVAMYRRESYELVELSRRDLETGRLSTIDDPQIREQFDNSSARRWLAELRQILPGLLEDYLLRPGVGYVRRNGEVILGVKEHDAGRVRDLVHTHDVPDDADVDALAAELYLTRHTADLGLHAGSEVPPAMLPYGVRGLFDDDDGFRAFVTWDACRSQHVRRPEADRILRREVERPLRDVEKWLRERRPR